MRIAITGGSGRVGSYTVRELCAQGHQVWNLDRHHNADVMTPFIQTDLTDAGQVYDAMAQVKPEAVCHIAANPSPNGFTNIDTFHNNVLSTFAVLQAAGDLGARHIVYASSEMATGWLTPGDAPPPHLPFDETVRQPSGNTYALSKYAGEVIMDGMALRFPDAHWVSLRVNNVILPDDYGILAWRREDLRRGMTNFWSYIDVRDAATAFACAVHGGLPGHEVFLIAAADTSSDRPLPELMAECYPNYEGLDPAHPPYASVFSCRKIQRLLGWESVHSWREQSN
jgi:nucleoside-diphosphate-sugar epimerase